ncbi:LacI family DNA-binding transcriptional regulator [Microbacterium karelineae]|uniref:LacI family DNA-binding transcriptional regulator n=1 Tax=Microbacterium karelineae TaxID=2654283 RepID=UPI0012EAB349|nr:LacI family DNA-binding transcriptional regulator [Microbacterium karelineae]
MKRPTLRDVAERAGVSVSAVSYALNENSDFPLAERTRSRIRRIAREIGYVPNSLARSLRQRAARLIGVILDKPLAYPRYAAIADGLAQGVAAEGYQLMFLATRDHLAGVDAVRSGQLDGLVFVGHDDHAVPDDLARAIAEHDIPFGAIDCGSADVAYSTVDFDYARGVQLVVERLVADGVRTVHYVRPEIASHAERVREQAMFRELAAHPDVAVHVLQTTITSASLAAIDASETGIDHRADLARRIGELLDARAAPPDTTAFVCSWGADVETVFATARARDPRCRVVGLAAGALDPALWPGVSYASLPLAEGGRACAGLVVVAARDGSAPEHLLLAPTLVG